MIQDVPPKLRWPRSQQFVLSERGAAAEHAYREVIVASRETGGRASFDAARSKWAAEHKVEADDGLYLGEVGHGPIRMSDLAASVESAGKTPKDARAALERLFSAELVRCV